MSYVWEQGMCTGMRTGQGCREMSCEQIIGRSRSTVTSALVEQHSARPFVCLVFVCGFVQFNLVQFIQSSLYSVEKRKRYALPCCSPAYCLMMKVGRSNGEVTTEKSGNSTYAIRADSPNALYKKVPRTATIVACSVFRLFYKSINNPHGQSVYFG